MNLDEYLALVEQENSDSEPTEQPEETVETQEETPEETIEESKPEETTEDTKQKDTKVEEPEDAPPSTPDKLEIEGIGEVTLDDIKEWYKGNLRQQDYTRKTQELAKMRKEASDAIQLFEYFKQNPHIAQRVLAEEQVDPQVSQTLNPAERRIAELQRELYDMKLQQDIAMLESRYDDFEVREVLQIAQDRKIYNLEDAYKLWKAEQPVSSVKEDNQNMNTSTEQVDNRDQEIQTLKQELEELKRQLLASQDTTTVISNKGTPPQEKKEPNITPEEKRIAQMMRLSDEEYIKWRDMGNK